MLGANYKAIKRTLKGRLGLRESTQRRTNLEMGPAPQGWHSDLTEKV